MEQNKNQELNKNQKPDEEAQTQLKLQVEQLRQAAEVERLSRQKIQEAEAQAAAEKEAKELEEAMDLRNAFDDNSGTKPDDVEDLTNRELINIIIDASSKSSDARSKQTAKIIEDRMKETNEKLVNTQRAIMQVLARIGIQEAKAKFPDFDKYREDISKEMSKYPNLDIEDAIILVKGRAAMTVPPKKQVESERPNMSIPQRETSETTVVDKKPAHRMSSPARDFKEIVQRGIKAAIESREQR